MLVLRFLFSGHQGSPSLHCGLQTLWLVACKTVTLCTCERQAANGVAAAQWYSEHILVMVWSSHLCHATTIYLTHTGRLPSVLPYLCLPVIIVGKFKIEHKCLSFCKMLVCLRSAGIFTALCGVELNHMLMHSHRWWSLALSTDLQWTWLLSLLGE